MICKQCGVIVKRGHLKHNRWHKVARRAVRWRRGRMPLAQIAERLGFSRAYLSQRFKYWGKEQ